MSASFEQKLDNISKCLENLRLENYKAATSDLYPVSKSTSHLGNASDGTVCKFVSQMISVLEVLKDKVGDPDKPADLMDNARFLLMDVYRILRTSCAANTQVQDEFGGEQAVKVMECTRIILSAAHRYFLGESLIQLLAVGIQFLANLAAGCQKNQDLVWDHFYMHLKGWLDMAKGEPETNQERSIKVLNYTCGLIENCLPRQWERDPHFLENPHYRAVLISAVQANTVWKLEFGKKVMAKLVQVPNLLRSLFGELNHDERMCLLAAMQEVITEWRSCDETGSEVPTIQSNLFFMIELLILGRDHMTTDQLQAREASFRVDLHEQVKMLEVLSQASCCSSYIPDLSDFTVQAPEEPKSLLMYALGLLKDIHKKGGEGTNMLSQVSNPLEVDTSHPGFMLRRDLIRIIGNLAYQNKKNQDVVREAYGKVGIPLLFDHTKVDERNPYIAEWAKLALTNLVRDNEENAKYVKDMKLQGHVDPTGILRDCGLTLETRGDKVVVTTEGPTPSLSRLSEKAPPRP